jgi:hypothetical protein
MIAQSPPRAASFQTRFGLALGVLSYLSCNPPSAQAQSFNPNALVASPRAFQAYGGTHGGAEVLFVGHGHGHGPPLAISLNANALISANAVGVNNVMNARVISANAVGVNNVANSNVISANAFGVNNVVNSNAFGGVNSNAITPPSRSGPPNPSAGVQAQASNPLSALAQLFNPRVLEPPARATRPHGRVKLLPPGGNDVPSKPRKPRKPRRR